MRQTSVLALLPLALAACATATAGHAPAGEHALGRIETDRPSFVEGAGVLAPSHVQAEAGYTLRGDGALHEHTVGELVVRAGLGARAELRMGTTWDAVHEHGATARGLRDGTVGAKLNLVRASRGVVPALSLVGGSTLPSGSDGFSEGHATPEAKLVLGWSLSEHASLAVNGNWARPTDEAGHYTTRALGAFATRELGEHVATFAELYSVRDGRDAERERFVDGGFTFGLGESAQLDVRAGSRLGHGEGKAFFAGVGIARRW